MRILPVDPHLCPNFEIRVIPVARSADLQSAFYQRPPARSTVTCADGPVVPGLVCSPAVEHLHDQRSVASTAQSIIISVQRGTQCRGQIRRAYVSSPQRSKPMTIPRWRRSKSTNAAATPKNYLVDVASRRREGVRARRAQTTLKIVRSCRSIRHIKLETECVAWKATQTGRQEQTRHTTALVV